MEWTREFRARRKKERNFILNVLVRLRHAELITDERETITSVVPPDMNSCRSNPEMLLIFSLLLCQSIPAAAKKLTI